MRNRKFRLEKILGGRTVREKINGQWVEVNIGPKRGPTKKDLEEEERFFRKLARRLKKSNKSKKLLKEGEAR